MRMSVLTLLAATIVVAACNASRGDSPPEPSEVQALRQSLAPYTSLALARAAGYSQPLSDCMSNGDLGAMGVHFGNLALIDAVVAPDKPEVLIYEPGTDGQMSLVGVEFIIPFTLHPKSEAPPVLFGQPFIADDAFGLWGLHVWTQRANPSGLFAPWNPRVHC